VVVLGPLPQSFYRQNTTVVAKKLLGKILCRKWRGKVHRYRIVETEAYLGIEDPACHTFGGRNTKRVKSMYLDGGHSYIYLIYGMYYCLNVVTKTPKHPEAVLIRALEPIPIKTEQGLHTNGPGKLCRHLHLTKKEDGLSLWKKNLLWIENAPRTKKQIVAKSRIGVDYAGSASSWPLRFYIKNNPYVSRI
jgi:DNA-3-methyladenine glycosylase